MADEKSVQQKAEELDNLLQQLQDMDRHKAFLRDEIKAWETAFAEKSGRVPEIADKKKIKRLYGDYAKVI